MDGSSGEGVRASERDLSLAQNAASCLPVSDSKLSTTLPIVFVLNVSARSTRLGRELMMLEMLEADRRSSTIFSEVTPGNPDMLLHTWVGFNQ